MTKTIEQFSYDNKSVRNFALATAIWGVVGMSVGLWAAFQLFIPSLNLSEYMPFFSFGRIRPLHTNAVIFAFVGNGIFMGVYYSLQRLLKTRMYSDVLSAIHFWGWQAIITAAAITLPLGLTSTHEYAELTFPIDIAIAVVWIVFGINMIGTMIKRRENHIYVAIWFYIATWATITVLHIGNNLQIPYDFWHSYPVFAGVQDALIQWWYGHNAVAFFLTTPYLGLMYYYLPKAANRPVFSYRLSIIHFWSLIFIYIWAGPHHLLYTSLPDWAQSLGTVFSIMLLAPSWGGMLNGLLTLGGAWDRVRTDPILKFMVVAVTAYGMSTFEGPMLALKSVNAISHYTDWTVGHVHIGTLGWNGMMTFGVMYWLIPRIYDTKLHSVKLANTHFWIATLGTFFYAVPLYVAGWTQHFMWKYFLPDGSLQYPNFLETVTAILPMYMMRAFGGTIYLAGVLLMAWNLWKTAKSGHLVANEAAEAPARIATDGAHKGEHWHRRIERKPLLFTFLATIAILIGGIIEFTPMVMIDENVPKIAAVQPYTPLELEGRDLYIKEGCVQCHSQMVRPFRWEVARYDIAENAGYSKSGEFIYDRPFLWGSKRTGPDLHRVGGKYNHAWHFTHMLDPRVSSPGSIMPAYPFLFTDDLDTGSLPSKIRVLQMLNTPYPEGYDKIAQSDLEAQAKQVTEDLMKQIKSSIPDFEKQGVHMEGLEKKEIIALIAYLQRLGTDIRPK